MAKKTLIIFTVAIAIIGGKAHVVEADTPLRKRVIMAAICIQRADGGGGSGIVTMINGVKYVLTANHVVKGAPYVRLVGMGDRSFGYVKRCAGWHDKYDIASLRLPRSLQHLPAIPLHKGKPPIGTQVYLTGLPGGHLHITEGRVSGYDYSGSELRHTAASKGGASGGALVTSMGTVCGIHTGAYLPGSSLYPQKSATPSMVIIRLISMNCR